ncbi:aminodeoxychorismate synthase component I [Mangrovimonas cancribranchiae]|uniref:Aminodeoxychorismate synthase component I n=1 Tax=Mangrovimonas cancribranchiae TaxID=3080055 RepID=A0AAU6P002_9FLAO
MRKTYTYKPNNITSFKKQLLAWAQQFYEVVWLDSNNFKKAYSNFDAVLAVDALTSISTDYHDAFQNLKEYQTNTNDWIFGYLSYDLKNDVETLNSNNFDGLKFPELMFFQPKKLFFIKGEEVVMQYLNMVDDEIEDDIDTIQNTNKETENDHQKLKIKRRLHKDEYYNKVENMLEHIHRGDIYEANFCQEFYAEQIMLNPLSIYNNLNGISKPPFATFLKFEDKYILSASPERYLKKQGNTIISQPIKGTAKRSTNFMEDKELKEALKIDEKERSENIMIVDLVRNDLSKTATKGSVTVEELCEVYTFPQVHQMISTVTSTVNENTHPIDILKTTFPMGSMTGAPKVSAMKIIEDLEETKRGVYSGTVGYISPSGDFDFNVIIRSILYNKTKQYVSYSVGGAITAKSNPVKEYEECLIKAKAMREVLEN